MAPVRPPLVIGVSGASGAPIAVRLLAALRRARVPVTLVVSDGGRKVLAAEDGGAEPLERLATTVYADSDLAAPIASGTQPTRGMAIVPCSANTVARLALGLGDSLIARAAHVTLKEHRKLVIVPRETPVPTVMLRHLTTLSELGVVVLPPTPAYYLKPTSIDDVSDYVVGKLLDQFAIRHRLYRPWSPGAR